MPDPQPLYLPGASGPAFATVHRPAPGGETQLAVLICPPFGWDEVCSYRPLRHWAERLAADGHATLRLSYPGTGDSGGDSRDPDLLAAWVSAVATAAVWLQADSGAERVAALGIGLGGLLASLATADRAPIDDLILWGAPARGRTLLRGLRAFAALELAQCYEGLGEPPADAGEPGDVEAGGFLISAPTAAALEAVDLGAIAFPADGRERRALLLERDGIAVDPGLRPALERAGIVVTVAPGDGFADASSHPQTARAPAAVIERVGSWLAERDASSLVPPRQAPAAAPSTEIHLRGGALVRETAIAIARESGTLAGVLTEPLDPPADGLCVVMLNAGAVRRIGPGRMWVEAARRWAAAGVTTLRLDSEAIGDSDGDERPYVDDGALYTPVFVPQALAALDFLEARGAGRRFVLGGLCSGANWAFHAALRDDRVHGVLLVNPRALVYSESLGPGRDLRALLTQRPSLTKIRRIATGPRLHAFLRWLAGTPTRALARLRGGAPESSGHEHELDAALDAFTASGKHMLMLFSEHEPLHDELVRSGREQRLAAAPNVIFEHVRIRDHTLRPLWAQAAAHAALDRALAREPGVGISVQGPAG